MKATALFVSVEKLHEFNDFDKTLSSNNFFRCAGDLWQRIYNHQFNTAIGKTCGARRIAGKFDNIELDFGGNHIPIRRRLGFPPRMDFRKWR